MRILKEEVLKALTYPHLAPGQFVRSDSEIARKALSKVPKLVMCPVAATLAIRNRGEGTVENLALMCYEFTGWAEYRGTTRTQVSPRRDAEIQRLKKLGHWLDLLSCEFEYLCEKYPQNLPYAKGELVKFVKARFPPYFDIKPIPPLSSEEENAHQ
jgi:hypothetical protein